MSSLCKLIQAHLDLDSYPFQSTHSLRHTSDTVGEKNKKQTNNDKKTPEHNLNSVHHHSNLHHLTRESIFHLLGDNIHRITLRDRNTRTSRDVVVVATPSSAPSLPGRAGLNTTTGSDRGFLQTHSTRPGSRRFRTRWLQTQTTSPVSHQ